MNKYKSSAELKNEAKMQLRGNLGTVIGAFLMYMACMLSIKYISSSIALTSLTRIVMYTILGTAVSLIGGIFILGENMITLKIACGQQAFPTEIFSGFKDVQRAAGVYFVPALLVNLVTVPVILVSNAVDNFIQGNDLMREMTSVTDVQAMMEFMAKTDMDVMMETYEQLMPIYTLFFGVLILFCVVYLITQIAFSQVLFLMLDYPDKSAGEIVKLGFKVMKGNWGRYFYIMCSFVLWDLLAFFTCYLSTLWVHPYKRMTYTNFYLDLLKNYETTL